METVGWNSWIDLEIIFIGRFLDMYQQVKEMLEMEWSVIPYNTIIYV
jgi:hypothetical protein